MLANGWYREYTIINPIFAQAVSRNPSSGDSELIIDPSGTKRTEKIPSIDIVRVRAYLSKMVPTKDLFVISNNTCRIGDISPRFRILCYEHIVITQHKFPDFSESCCGFHQLKVTSDVVPVIYINIIAETHRFFSLDRVFINVAELGR